MNKKAILIAPILAAFAMSACVEDGGETVEKQAYKGAADTPSADVNAEERTAALSERFNLIQTDR